MCINPPKVEMKDDLISRKLGETETETDARQELNRNKTTIHRRDGIQMEGELNEFRIGKGF